MPLPKIKRPDRFEWLSYTIIALCVISLIGIWVLVHNINKIDYDCFPRSEKPETQEDVSLICPECDSIPNVMYEYSDGSTGSLKYNRFAKSVGVEIHPR